MPQPGAESAAEYVGQDATGHPLRHERAQCDVGGWLYGSVEVAPYFLCLQLPEDA